MLTFGDRKSQILPVAGLAVALATASLALAKDEGGGFGMGPGMVMVESIQPGAEEFDIATRTGFVFEVINGTPDKHTFTVSLRTTKSSLGAWEMGYEDIPDISWLRLDKTEVEVPAKSKAPIKLFVKVPNKPENYNRKWMAVVACSPGSQSSSTVGAALMVASRVQLETVPKVDTDGLNAGAIAITPSALMAEEIPMIGSVWKKPVQVRNNTKEARTYTQKAIADLEKNPAKHERYFGSGFVPLLKESWVKVSENSFKLEPGEVKSLTVTVSVPKEAEVGKRYEELVFLQDDKGKIDFFRVRTEIAKDAVQKDKGTAEKK